MKRGDKVITLEKYEYYKTRAIIQAYFMGACSLSKVLKVDDIITSGEDIDAIAEKILEVIQFRCLLDDHASYIIKYRNAIKVQREIDPQSTWWVVNEDDI